MQFKIVEKPPPGMTSVNRKCESYDFEHLVCLIDFQTYFIVVLLSKLVSPYKKKENKYMKKC